MSERRFKVGDRITLLDDLSSEHFDKVGSISGIVEYRGMTSVIEDVVGIGMFILKADRDKWTFQEEAFKEFYETKKIKISYARSHI